MRSAWFVTFRSGVLALATVVMGVNGFLPATSAEAASPQIPALQWQERSDRINVKTDIAPAAIGDGKADDTVAIQKALNGVRDGSVLYFPPGIPSAAESNSSSLIANLHVRVLPAITGTASRSEVAAQAMEAVEGNVLGQFSAMGVIGLLIHNLNVPDEKFRLNCGPARINSPP